MQEHVDGADHAVGEGVAFFVMLIDPPVFPEPVVKSSCPEGQLLVKLEFIVLFGSCRNSAIPALCTQSPKYPFSLHQQKSMHLFRYAAQ